ncbi:MAG: hypothetical protein WCO84_06230 [bacterium]
MRSIPCPISQDELKRLVCDRLLTDADIADLLEGGTVHRVQSWRKRFGIAAIPRWSRNEITPIEGRLQSLLVGSMLGDGRLVHRTHATHYSERHCGAQQPYLEWKAGIWGPWASPVKDIPDKRGYPTVGMFTCAHELLNEWQELFYASPDKGWKRLLPRVVDLVDEFALTIWYLDDGCAAWWPNITFGADEASRAVAFSIFEKFGMKPRWCPKKGNTGDFCFERENTAQRFIDIIKPHVPDCMVYKLGPFGFQGPHYQVRQKVTADVLREMTASGMSIRTMADRLGVGFATISRRLRKFDIDHPRKIGRPSLT